MTIHTGDTVVYKGSPIREQIAWANTDYPTNLIVGKQYIIESVDVHHSFTRVTLLGTEGVFNSVHFQIV